MKEQVEALTKKLALEPHPEGGFFKETYRSEGFIAEANLNGTHEGDRSYATCIYFMLTSEAFSAFHKIRQDEIWHFYTGSPIILHMISPSGDYARIEVGNYVLYGQHPQFVVPAGYWFASEVKEKDSYSLVGCTVSPGFDFRDFELANREELTSLFPKHQELIERLSRV